jgi:hypothetical protein
MFCEKAFELIKELHRSPDSLPLFNVSFFCLLYSETRIAFMQVKMWAETKAIVSS